VSRFTCQFDSIFLSKLVVLGQIKLQYYCHIVVWFDYTGQYATNLIGLNIICSYLLIFFASNIGLIRYT